MWVFISTALVVFMYAAAIYCGVRAAETARTPQGAVGWVVFLLATPFLAVPLYLFLGHHRFHGYRIARRESERVVQGLRQFAEEHAPDPDEISINLGPFEAIANMPAVDGNRAELLIDGDAAFDAIFAAIDAAEEYVLVQFYIVRDDGLGRSLRDRMIAAARRGVKVRFMTDAVGSHGLPESYTEALRTEGIEVVDREYQRGPKFRFQINYRNHRKTVVVDGTTGFIGGLNVGDEYLGLDPEYGAWRDTHIQMWGPVVLQLQLIFVEDWHWFTGEPLLDEVTWVVPDKAGGVPALIVATGPGDETETGSMLFFSAIAEARERFWVASPYFVPDIDVMTALKHAALRGVDVRLLVPHVVDHHLPWLAAFAYFDDIREAGVRVFRYTEGFMHQKVFLVDDSLAAVGTTNLDNRSFRLNFEAMALFFHERAAQAAEEMLKADFARSFEMTRTLDQQRRWVRYGAPVARLLSPLL